MGTADLLHSIRVLAAVERSGLVFVPDLAKRTRAQSRGAFRDTLLSLYAAGKIELRPYSGLTPLTPTERGWCVQGMPGTSPLAYIRVR
jgi:hypothetical protein